MKAIMVDGDRLRWTDVPDPEPAADEALVRVRATAVNRADLAQRKGLYPPPPGASEILGLELAGEVVTAPPEAEVRPGQPVCALVAGGGYAQYAAVPRGLLQPVPSGWSWARAAALPETFLTAHLNLFLEAGLRSGERVLVHGGASGVGTAAIQLGVAAGARVAVTARGAKGARCRELGAELAVDYPNEDFAATVRDAWGEVDVILDMIGGAYAERNLGLLATGGRLVWIATLGGREVTLDVGEAMRRRLTLKGSTLRSRPLVEKVALTRDFRDRFGALLDEGRIGPVLDRAWPIERVEEAFEVVQRSEHVGKVALHVP